MVGELTAPVFRLARVGVAADPAPLPGREVGVLNGQRRRRGARVRRGQLADHDAHRPAVRGDVMDGQQQHVAIRAAPEQRGAHDRAALEVERPPRLVARHALDVGVGARGEIDGSKRQPHGRVNPLDRPPVHLLVGRTQNLVTMHDLLQRGFERLRVERAVEPQGQGDVVERVVGLEAVEKPEPLLRERQRERCGPIDPGDPAIACRGRRGLDGACQPCDIRRIEDLSKRELRAGDLPDPRHELSGDDRIAAQREEVVIGTDVLDAQQLAIDAGNRHLGRRAWLDQRRRMRDAVRIGQPAAIDLAVGGQRQRLEHHDGRGIMKSGSSARSCASITAARAASPAPGSATTYAISSLRRAERGGRPRSPVARLAGGAARLLSLRARPGSRGS